MAGCSRSRREQHFGRSWREQHRTLVTTTSKLLRTLFSIAFALSLTLFAHNALAVEYEVTGTFEASQHLKGGKSEIIAALHFRVYVRDCKWQIRISSDELSKANSYNLMSFDGNCVYSFGTNPSTGQGRDTWGGAVGPETVPFFGPVPSIPIIWIALASSCSLDETTGVMTPPYSVQLVRAPLPVQIERQTDKVRLPSRIIFMDDGFDRFDGNPSKRPAPYDTGFTNAIFSAQRFTNADGIGLPNEFELRVFSPSVSGKSKSDVALTSHYRGFVSNITHFCSVSDFTPQLPNSSGMISDTRFAISGAIVPMPFVYRGSNWLSEEELRQNPGFERYLAAQPKKKEFIPTLVTTNMDPRLTIGLSKSQSKTRLIVIAALVCASFIPIAFLCTSKLRKQRNTENINKNT
jgi:hypothetical protein